jgi:hypothetical protein
MYGMILSQKLPHADDAVVVDLYPLYPEWLIPEWMINLRAFYVLQYKDQNFLNPSPAFSLFIWLEGLYHLPLSIWATFAIWQDNPKVPIQLLIFAVEVAVSTGACIADAISWTNVSLDEKIQLGTLYLPYLALGEYSPGPPSFRN